MSVIRVGAVEYLNARPLVHGLENEPALFDVRFEVPAKCASLLHEGAIDLGLIPSIEYLRRGDYLIVPDMAVASRGAVASVALFTARPTTAIRSVAVDSSSRTAATLLHVLCAQWFDIEPTFVTMQPDLSAMLKHCDAALIIGDIALFTDHQAKGLDKIDLGEEWTAMTDRPFVWAFWTGRANTLQPPHLAALCAARDRGVRAVDDIARSHCPNDADREQIARDYLRENVRYGLGEAEKSGLRRFFDAARDLRIVPSAGTLRFYGERD